MGESSDSDSDSVESSELGKKEYWDAAYKQELANLRQLGHEGELWFGEDVMETMLRFITDQIRASFGDIARPQVSILDIGTGNGVLPLTLSALGYTRVTGSDYSQSSIGLARAVAERRGMTGVQWLEDDVLHSSLTERYKVITDKGTFDAIGLSKGGRAQQAQYIKSVHSLLQPGGLLILTSCNSTLQELMKAFTSDRRLLGPTLQHGNTGSDACTERPPAHDWAEVSPTACSGPGTAADSIASKNGHRVLGAKQRTEASEAQSGPSSSANCYPRWAYADHVRTYQVYSFGGYEGSKVCTIAFKRA